MGLIKALILIADGTEEMELYDPSLHLLLLSMTARQAHDDTVLLNSTITYDTLVRAGVSCTSAYVHAGGDNNDNNYTSPPFAKGSRGINILPDTYFSPQDATPVAAFVHIPHSTRAY